MAETVLTAAPGSRAGRTDERACRVPESERFTAATPEHCAAALAVEAAAKEICGSCPVRIPCRRHALAHRIPYGVRGGLTADERHVLLVHAAGPSS
ncbi:WhiB family transcriptional regulator [Streptomyces bambusae]|uniref:WhiB family transcriptional regulator n=1 Tax=Streptomyces bambusae TaxID=1550616 RepID=UPI001CFCD9ED|nr:WhiB family transcriptional regulator [Streptomyces bambusae]MCB5164456.1 WhiB family transcriptional regulator [Streptomyces bambusae]